MANHTSMIDFIIIEQMTAFAVIMQKHPGWVGKCLESLPPIVIESCDEAFFVEVSPFCILHSLPEAYLRYRKNRVH